jgi:hypothetical protein
MHDRFPDFWTFMHHRNASCIALLLFAGLLGGCTGAKCPGADCRNDYVDAPPGECLQWDDRTVYADVCDQRSVWTGACDSRPRRERRNATVCIREKGSEPAQVRIAQLVSIPATQPYGRLRVRTLLMIPSKLRETGEDVFMEIGVGDKEVHVDVPDLERSETVYRLAPGTYSAKVNANALAYFCDPDCEKRTVGSSAVPERSATIREGSDFVVLLVVLPWDLPVWPWEPGYVGGGLSLNVYELSDDDPSEHVWKESAKKSAR